MTDTITISRADLAEALGTLPDPEALRGRRVGVDAARARLADALAWSAGPDAKARAAVLEAAAEWALGRIDIGGLQRVIERHRHALPVVRALGERGAEEVGVEGVATC